MAYSVASFPCTVLARAKIFSRCCWNCLGSLAAQSPLNISCRFFHCSRNLRCCACLTIFSMSVSALSSFSFAFSCCNSFRLALRDSFVDGPAGQTPSLPSSLRTWPREAKAWRSLSSSSSFSRSSRRLAFSDNCVPFFSLSGCERLRGVTDLDLASLESGLGLLLSWHSSTMLSTSRTVEGVHWASSSCSFFLRSLSSNLCLRSASAFSNMAMICCCLASLSSISFFI
mmetsp:Transcript_135349/g.234731  ORF Transcript_135349/g.234731 Transcript_135349/m.234731 type:complete len:228 (-) Transcript_135349:2094-2777(-)